MPAMEFFLKFLALLSAGLFAGSAFYITAVEHPARMAAGVSVALQEFRKSYARAVPLQILFAAVSFLASAVVWLLTHQWSWITGGGLTGSVIPFTLAFIMPTNRLLVDVRSPLKEDAARALFLKWERLHAVRTFLGLLGFAVLLVRCLDS